MIFFMYFLYLLGGYPFRVPRPRPCLLLLQINTRGFIRGAGLFSAHIHTYIYIHEGHLFNNA